jgi:hypothetical protein
MVVMPEADFLKLRRILRWHVAAWLALVGVATVLIRQFDWWPIPTTLFVFAFFPGTDAFRLVTASYREYQELAPTLREAQPLPVGSLRTLVTSWSWITKGLLIALFGPFALFGGWALSAEFHWMIFAFTAICALISGYVAWCWIRAAFRSKAARKLSID